MSRSERGRRYWLLYLSVYSVSCDWDGWLKFGILVALMWFNTVIKVNQGASFVALGCDWMCKVDTHECLTQKLPYLLQFEPS